MSLPSQEVLDDIRDLISQVTGFQEHDENFAICERYCLSHVIHHTYPFVNRTSVKDVVNSYVSRFYSHGYFRISQELDYQVNRFLNNEKLFEKNPQYDIQWCLLSLVTSLSSNLTAIKEIPELLPIDDEETEVDDFDWKEYLTKDLPLKNSHSLSGENGESSTDSDDEDTDECENKCHSETSLNSNKTNSCQDKKQLEIIFDNKSLFNAKSSSDIRKQKIEDFLKRKQSKRDLENDFLLRGNFTETFDRLMNQEGIVRKSQIISEYELIENILYQFQTGEKIFLRKGLVNPALTSLTQDTLGGYLESLQLYFTIIRCFKDFDDEITKARYPESCLNRYLNHSDEVPSVKESDNIKRRVVPNVLYMYSVMLKKALEPFQNEVTGIVENLGNHTLIQVEQKLKAHYWDLTSLFQTHNLATKNWKKDCSWMSSVRVLYVLYNAIMDATNRKMNFLYLNFFLQCFQVYLDIIDNWISYVDLIDSKDEFIIAKFCREGSDCSEFEIRPYKTEMGERQVLILDVISEKMIHVGQSLEILRKLNRFVPQNAQNTQTFHQSMIKGIDEKIQALSKVHSAPEKSRPPEKQKGIFTMKNISLGLERDNGCGDSSLIGNLLMEMLENEKEKKEEVESNADEGEEKKFNYCGELIDFMVENQFFKMAFETVGMKQVEKQLKEAKARVKEESEKETLMIIRKPEDEKIGIYPIQKIINESFNEILNNRTSSACALVKNIVLYEFNLPIHLNLLRSILLFNHSYQFQSFIQALFTQPVIWRSSFSLTLHLKECARGFYKDFSNGLSVTLGRYSKFENVLDVIDVITVNYEVPWPLTLIITQDDMRKYNEIFRLALKLKWAHWALCSLQDENEKGRKSTRHRLQLLRFWLLSALGRINNYFLAQMTPPNVQLTDCKDLKEIISAHSEFVDKIHRNCLLGEKSPEGRKLILETLVPLCMDVFRESGNVNETKLSSMEKTFGSCHLLLSRLLSSLEK